MTLNNRISKLECALRTFACTCPGSAELAWPRHQPDPTCPTCGGERLVYQLPHHPRHTEPLLRNVLPLLAKTYTGDQPADLSRLADSELVQLRTALQAFEDTAAR